MKIERAEKRKVSEEGGKRASLAEISSKENKDRNWEEIIHIWRWWKSSVKMRIGRRNNPWMGQLLRIHVEKITEKNFEECNNLKALKFNTWKLNKMQYNWNWWPNDPVTHWNWTKLGILMVFGHLRLCWINSITGHHSWFQKIQKIRNWLIFFFQIFENVDNRLCCVIFASRSSSSYHLVMNKTMRINDFEMHGFIALHRSLP